MSTPDFVEPVAGYRVWGLDAGGRHLVLSALAELLRPSRGAAHLLPRPPLPAR